VISELKFSKGRAEPRALQYAVDNSLFFYYALGNKGCDLITFFHIYLVTLLLRETRVVICNAMMVQRYLCLRVREVCVMYPGTVPSCHACFAFRAGLKTLDIRA